MKQTVSDLRTALAGTTLGPEAREQWVRRLLLRLAFLQLAHRRDLLPRLGSATLPTDWEGFTATSRRAHLAGAGPLFLGDDDGHADLSDAVYRGAVAAVAGLETVEQLGTLHTRLLTNDARRRHGSHYTPRPLADVVVHRALRSHVGPKERICDPAMGCGAFLLAAARQLAEAEGLSLSAVLPRLWGVDIDPDAVALARLSLWLEARPLGPPEALLPDALQVADALTTVLPAGSADLVLGNPPYIPFYGRGSQTARFPRGYRDRIRELHGTIDGHDCIGGRLNLFLPFCARATSLLRPGGVAALVLPDAVLTNSSYEPLRRTLTTSGRLLAAIRCGDDLFPGASVGTAVIVWGQPRTAAMVALCGEEEMIEPVEELLSRHRCSWMPISTRELRRRTIPPQGMVPLGEVALIRDGLNTGSKETRQLLLTRSNDGDPTLRRCLEGRCIQPFRLDVGGLWVRYDPGILRSVPGRGGASLGSQTVFDAPKIVYRQTATHPIAAVDEIGLCYRNSAHGVVLFEHHDDVMWALCAWLNAAPLRLHYQTLTGEVRRTFPQLHIASMKHMPVPEVLLDPDSEVTRQLSGLARRAEVAEIDVLARSLVR